MFSVIQSVLDQEPKKNLCLGRQGNFHIHLNGVGASGSLVKAENTFFVEYLFSFH
jgi:hypothetical protein